MDRRTGTGRRPTVRAGHLRDLLTAAVLPLLPAALLTAAASAALSAHEVSGDASAVLTAFTALALAALAAGVPTALNAALLTVAGVLLGRRVAPRDAWRRAWRLLPWTLLWAAALGCLGWAAIAFVPRPAAAGAEWVLLPAAAALAAMLPALLLPVPVSVLTGRSPLRELPGTLGPRRAARLLAGLPGRVRLPEAAVAEGPVSEGAVPLPVLAAALLLVPLALTGPLPDTSAPSPAAESGRTTVHIAAADGSRHLEVDLAAPGHSTRARMGDHVVGAYWRSGPVGADSTLYLRVCAADEACGGPAVRVPPASASVTVEVDGPDSVRLVLLSCGSDPCPGHSPGGTADLASPAGEEAGAKAAGTRGPAPPCPDCASDT